MRKHDFLDIRNFLDEIFTAAEDITSAIACEFSNNEDCCTNSPDYYPQHSYPPVNVFVTEDRTMVIQFAIAGFSESDIDLEFKGDYLFFSAKVSSEIIPPDSAKFFKKRLKLKDVDSLQFYVPADRYQQDKVEATLKFSILTVRVPPLEKVEPAETVKVNIQAQKSGTQSKPASSKKD